MIFISAYKNLQSTILSLIVLGQGFPFLYFLVTTLNCAVKIYHIIVKSPSIHWKQSYDN